MNQMFRINPKSNSFATDFTKTSFKNHSVECLPTISQALVLCFIIPRMPKTKYNGANTFSSSMSMSVFYKDVLLSNETMANPQTFANKGKSEPVISVEATSQDQCSGCRAIQFSLQILLCCVFQVMPEPWLHLCLKENGIQNSQF